VFCSKCGNELAEDSRFCNSCGAEASRPAPPTEPEATTPISWRCESCGNEQAPGNRFCGVCGAPAPHIQVERTAVMRTESGVPASPPQPTQTYAAVPLPPAPSADGRRRPTTRVLVIGALAAALILLLAVLAAFALTGTSSTSSDAHAAAKKDQVPTRIRTIVAPVETKQVALSTAAQSLNATKRALRRLRNAASNLSQAVTTAESQSAALVASSSRDRQQITALNSALNSLDALASYLSSTPRTGQGFTQSFSAPITTKVSAVRASFVSLSGLVGNLALAPVSPAAWNFAQVVAGGRQQAEMRTFIVKMENLLTQSSSGRAQISTAIGDVQNNCSISPDQASQEISQVASNRQSLLDQASALTVPQSAAAQQILNSFQQALQHSIAADNDYSAWMENIFNYYYEPPQGCFGFVPTDDGNYSQAVSEDSQASAAKQTLVGVFDRVARQYGLRSNWGEGDI
jgi:hypothetical protein